MNFNNELEHQKNLNYEGALQHYGEYRGFRELVNINELESKVVDCDYLCFAKAIIVEIEIPKTLSLIELSEINNKLSNTLNSEIELIYF